MMIPFLTIAILLYLMAGMPGDSAPVWLETFDKYAAPGEQLMPVACPVQRHISYR